MSAIDLEREFDAAFRATERRSVAQRFGIPIGRPAWGVCRIERLGPVSARLYVPDPDGSQAIVVPVWDQGHLTDLLAFLPDEPDLWMSRFGDPVLLGSSELERAKRQLDEGYCGIVDPPAPPMLRVFSGPLAYLRGEGDGIVVLNPKRAAWRIPPEIGLLCDDEAQGLALRESYRWLLGQPSIFHPVSQHHEAAA
jgi:hypothetical protein